MTFRLVSDPRGNWISIDVSTVAHAAPHWETTTDALMDRLVVVCSDPDFITSNPGNFRVRRTGDEAYFRHFADLGKIVMVPVKLSDESRETPSETVLNVRIALTCYAKDEAPALRRLWSRKV